MNIFHHHWEFLKNEAEILLKHLHKGDPQALTRFRTLELFQKPEMSLQDIQAGAQLKHSLLLIALDNGYDSWGALKAALDEKAENSPLAEITEQFYPKHFTTYWNIWFANYRQAKKVLTEGKGYLLPYKHQFFICEEHFVDSIGIPHTMQEWKAIDRDWVHPKRVKEWIVLNEIYEKMYVEKILPMQ
jgi:hypothetical protein